MAASKPAAEALQGVLCRGTHTGECVFSIECVLSSRHPSVMPAALPLPQGHHSRLDCLEPKPGRPGPHGEARGASCVAAATAFHCVHTAACMGTSATLLQAMMLRAILLRAILHAGNHACGQSCMRGNPPRPATPLTHSPAHLPACPTPAQVGGDAQFVRPCLTCPTGVSTPAFNLGGYSPSAFTAPQAAPYAVAASGTADGGGAIWAQVRSWAQDLCCWACWCHVKCAPPVLKCHPASCFGCDTSPPV